MGITGQGKCLYSSTELKSTNIYHVVREQYRLNTTTTTNNNNSNTTTTTTKRKKTQEAAVTTNQNL